MPHNEHYRCAICDADFKDWRALNDHEKEQHTQQNANSPAVPSNEYPEPDNPDAQDRQHKKFERRNWE